jgi:hypothetical protein
VQLVFAELGSEFLRVLLRHRVHRLEPQHTQSARGVLGVLSRLPADLRGHGGVITVGDGEKRMMMKDERREKTAKDKRM